MSKIRDLIHSSKVLLREAIQQNPDGDVDDIVFDIVESVLPSLPSQDLELVGFGQDEDGVVSGDLESLRDELISVLQEELDTILLGQEGV